MRDLNWWAVVGCTALCWVVLCIGAAHAQDITVDDIRANPLAYEVYQYDTGEYVDVDALDDLELEELLDAGDVDIYYEEETDE